MEDIRDEAQKYPNSVPFPWIEARLRQLGLEVYTHNFTLEYPLGESKTFTGQNVYAILRAPRASSTEALILSVPYRPPYSLDQGTDTSLAVLLATAKFFRRQNYWAKDVIFLVTQHEQLGAQAWLEAYHQRSCGSGILNYGDLESRAGSIQAAINLEISEPKITHFNVKVEGLNGQLPNLDLVNLVNRLCIREGVGQMFQGVEDHPRPDSLRGYTRSLQTLFAMATKQAAGVPSGNHGLFHRFGIEAVTIEGVYHKTKKRFDVDVYTIGRIIEGIFRSLNNLLERFHQSFFFYLLPSSSRYVSIGMYMPAFGFLGGSLVITAIGLWFDCISEEQASRTEEHNKKVLEEEEKKKLKKQQKQDSQSSKKNKNRKGSRKDSEESDDEDDGGDQHPDLGPSMPIVIPSSMSSVLPNFILAHILGLLLVYLPRPVSVVGAKLGFETDDGITLGLLAYLVYSLLLPRFMRRSVVISLDNWKVMKSLALLELATLAFTISLSNFSLAYFVTVAYVPFALIASPSAGRIKWAMKVFVSLLTHPFSMLVIVCTLDTFRSFGDKSVMDKVLMSTEATKRAVTYSLTDAMIYGNLSYSLAAVFLFPCWYLLYGLNFANMQRGEDSQNAQKIDNDKKSD